jgi:hypothetical protein
MADQLGRFGIAIAVVTLIATGLYQFSGLNVVESSSSGIVLHSRNYSAH